jgi:hypothetical protein
MVRTAVIVLGLLAAMAGLAVRSLPLLAPAPSPVQPAGILVGLSSADASDVRAFYAAMADIVVRDGMRADPVAKTTFELRHKHTQALATAFANTGMVGKYEGLGDRLDQYLLRAIGDTDRPLTSDLRQTIAEAFAAIK